MTGEAIYKIFQDELDGEEFESNEQALRAMNVAYREILAEREWEFLKKTSTLAAGVNSLTGITDFKKLLIVWATKGQTNDEIELVKGNWSERFDYDIELDYVYDQANRSLSFRYPEQWAAYQRIVDYIFKPDDLTMETEPVFDDEFCPRIAYKMVLSYKRGDEGFDGYREVTQKESELEAKMTDYDDSLNDYHS